MLQLRYTLAIAIALAAAVMTVSANKARIIEIDQVTHDDNDGPVESTDDKNRKAELSRLYAQIDGVKTDIKEYLKRDPSGQIGKPALDNLKQLSDALVEAMYPTMEDSEKAAMKQSVYEDIMAQCKCEASAELQGISPMCKKTTQEQVKEALSN